MLKTFQKDFFLQLGSSIIIALLQSHHQVKYKIVYTTVFSYLIESFFFSRIYLTLFLSCCLPLSCWNLSETVRVETGVEQGDTVSMHYDPMIAKLVVWGGNRGEALVKLKDCLSNFQVDSLRTCILELSAILIIPQHNYKSSRPYGSIVNFLRNLFEFLAHRFLVTTIVQ